MKLLLLLCVTVLVAQRGFAETILSHEQLRGLAAAGNPSPLSPLRGVKRGDPSQAPADEAMRRALCDPDEVWTLTTETTSVDPVDIAVRDGKAWAVRVKPAGLSIDGPLDASDPAACAASLLSPSGSQVLDAAGDLDDSAWQTLLALAQVASRPAPASSILDRLAAGKLVGRDEGAAALEALQSSGWIRLGQSRPEPLWDVLRPEALATIAAPKTTHSVLRRTRNGTAAPPLVIFAGEKGLVVFESAGEHLSGRPAGLLAAALKPAAAASAPPPAAASRAGDAIRAELEKGVFRLGQATSTRDAFGRGQADTWRIEKVAEYQDTTGTGAIDWVKVDDFGAGKWTRAFVLLDGKWQESNILDVFLEIEFKLPWDRSAYHPHNVEVRLNGKAIASLEDTLPEGWYRFQLRPQDVQLPQGAGTTNEVRLVTQHLRGGHYVVSTSFNLAFQLATVSRYVIANDEADAHKILMESGKFTSGGVDAALYANEWTASNARPKEGESVTLKGLVRNLGGNPIAGGRLVVLEGGKEIASRDLPPVGGADLAACEIAVKLTPGVHRLSVSATVDGDPRPQNNAVPFEIRCGGDDTKPDLAVTSPAEGAAAGPGDIVVSGTSADNVGVQSVEISVNGGLWVAVPPAAKWESKVTIGKGPQRIRVRCVDTSGNVSEVLRVIEGK